MRRSGSLRRLVALAPWTALLLGIGCGDGAKGPTGPGGEPTIAYELVSLGRVGLQADLALEDCTLTRFYGGGMELTDDGSWRISLQVHDHSGDWGYLDRGEVWEEGGALWFDSVVSGASYQAAVEGSPDHHEADQSRRELVSTKGHRRVAAGPPRERCAYPGRGLAPTPATTGSPAASA